MPETLFFYDLETSGRSPRFDRIMQFAGQRTNLDFEPIGEPVNLLVELADDTLPSPQAIMITGITPQSTRLDGISEREFCKYFINQIAAPGTTMLGYNSVRFDDEFMRATLWRNFYDAYEWQWKDGRSRWDLLDVVRMTRALRPEGIKWPFTPEGKPTNRLELITKENNIVHAHAHDALSDVEALISVTKLIKEHQPQLFDFLYRLRNKRDVAQLVNLKNPQPFVYASGRYSSDNLHTTVAIPVAEIGNGNLLVFDLRYNVDELLAGEAAAEAAGTIDKTKPFRERDPWERDYFPIIKKLQLNHCPAVAPLGVLSKEDGWQKIGLTPETVEQNLQSLRAHPEFIQRAGKRERDTKREIQQKVKEQSAKFNDVGGALYDGFLDDSDSRICAVVRANLADDLTNFHPHFKDKRLPDLLLHYKAKNFPSALSSEESTQWEEYRLARLRSQEETFLQEIQAASDLITQNQPLPGNKTADECQYLIDELMLWYQSLQSADL